MTTADEHNTGTNNHDDHPILNLQLRRGSEQVHVRHLSHYRDYQLTPNEALELARWLTSAARLIRRNP